MCTLDRPVETSLLNELWLALFLHDLCSFRLVHDESYERCVVAVSYVLDMIAADSCTLVQ